MGISAIDADGLLTDAAITWQTGLAGITLDQVAIGLKRAIMSGDEWQPSLPKFIKLCVQRDDVPCVQEVIKIIQKEPYKAGNVAERYIHPIVLAIVQNTRFSRDSFRNGSQEQCEKLINPIYDDLVVNGWNDFLPEHYETHVAIESKPSTREFALENLAKIKSNLKAAIEQDERNFMIDRVNRIMQGGKQ
jgi:hypothetical protein